MEFFGMGAGEILLILLLALIIWGPGKIPEIARTLGKTMRAFRKATFDLTSEITKELEIDEKKRSPVPPAKPEGQVENKKPVNNAEGVEAEH